MNGSSAAENYSTFNALDTDIIEITDDFTFFAGDHEIVIGTHNEIYSFKNLFIQNGFGSYEFGGIDDFYDGIARRYHHNYPKDPDNPADSFDTAQVSLYAGDTWRVKSNFTLVYGLRVDVPLFPDKPEYNPPAEDELRCGHLQHPGRQHAVVAADRFQLGHLGRRHQPAARRRRSLHGPHPLRVGLQQLRPNRHPPGVRLCDGCDPLQSRSLRPADRHRRRRQRGDQRHRSRFQLPADLARQYRL